MTKHLEHIYDVLQNANSKKVTDRRNCVGSLLHLYENKEIIAEICESSKHNTNIVTWSYIIHTIHKLLISEADRLASKEISNKSEVERNICLLVENTFRHADFNKKSLLKCNDVMPLILQVISRTTYKPYYDTYLKVLISYVLPLRIHQVNMLPEFWEELLDVLCKLYKHVSSVISKRAVLDALHMSVQYGCLHSNVNLNVSDILSFIESTLPSVVKAQEVLADSFYKLTNTVCRHIAAEYRIVLCHFSETVSSRLSSLKGPIEKYEVLLLFVRIHHSEGVSKGDDRAYANDWTQWYAELRNMYVNILKDFKAGELPRTFVRYAAEVFKQILENTDLISERELVSDYDYMKPSKRRRISARINGPVDMLDIYDPEETWPTVQVFTELFKRYPECLKSEDFPALLKTLLDILTLHCKDENITDSLYELFAVLLTNEKMYVITDIESSNIIWDKIWDILLRSLNVNQNETSTHTLTQLFIINNKITNPNVVLKLYLTNVIKWSVMSVRTLIVLCEHFPLPADISVCSINEYSPTMDANSVRSSLIKWLLNIPWQRTVTEIIIDELCLSLISMTLKTKHENRIRFKEYNVNDQCDCLEDENSESFYEHIEQCYLLLTYKKNLFTDDAKRSEKPKAKVNEHVLYMQEILTFMTNSLYSMINETVRGDLDVIIIKVAIVAKAVSMMKELNMISKNIEELQLVQGLKKYMANVNTLLERLNPSKENYSYLYRVTKALCSLYETSYDVQVAEIIVSSATLNMLKNIFNLMNIADDEIAKYEISKNYINQQRRRKCLNREDVEEECCKYCDKGTIRIQATKALALFCCITVEQESSHEIQIKLMNNFLNINMYDLSHTVNFKMAVMVLKSLSMYGEGRLWENHRYSPLENLLTLHRTCYKDETSMRYIFSVFPYFFKYSLEHDSCKINDLMKIIVEFNKLRSEKKRYGFVAQIEYVKCLSEIIRISPSHLHYSTNEALDEMSVLEGLLSSLTSSSFMVRKEAIKWIQSIYSSKSIAFLWKEALFARIEALARAIAIDEKTNVRINADKKEITTASTLLTLGAIASTSGAFQSQALSLMLQFTVDNEIDCEKMLKTINIATDRVNCSNLIEKNLSFLLTYWYNSEYSSRSFPWKLMRCESETQFYQTCSNTLAFVKFKRLDLPEVASVCNRANLPFEQVIENIFPEVLAWLLYCVDGNERTISKQSAYEVFHKFQSNEDEFCRMRKFSSLLNGNFAKILVYLVGRLHDEDHLEETLGIRMSLALSDPPHFKKPAIDNCLKLIVSNYFQDGVTLLEYLLRCNGSRILQRVLSDLNERIHKQGFEEHRIKAFHQYAYFCTLVIDELPREYFDAMSTYVIKDIGYSLLHVIKIYDDVRRLACRYFYDFVKRMFPVRSEQVKQILKFTVAVLVPIVQTEETSVALDILNFLIVDQKALLSDVIQNLNVFPNIPVFQRIREIHNNLKHQTKRVHTLEEEIQYFLNTMIDKNMDCSMEDISHLLMQLSTRKEELRRLYDALEKFRGFSEDCATSLLHQLVYKLIKLTGSAEMDVSIEAARCLGELGPTDLMSMILYLEKGHIKESSDVIEILSYKIIIMMVKFLFESDIELRRISAGVLNVVLSSFWGRQLLNATYMNSLKSVLGESQVPPLETSNIQPFILANDKCLKESNIGINETNLNEILDQDNTIWTIQSEDSYSDWIVQATCKVAVCFTRFYSEYLIPVCRLSTDFCEMILPRIVYLIIHTDENSTSAIWKCIDRFFEHHFNFNTETNVPSHKSTNCDHRIVRCMLNIVNYIRMQIPSNHLKLNYIHIAKAAHYCSAYFTAILYAEMSCEAILNDDDRSTSVSKIDRVYQLSPRQGKVIQGILRDSYAKLGDLDAISGTGSSHLQHYSTRIQHYVHTNQWDRVMLANDVELSFGNTTMIREMANGLHQSGLQYLLGNFISMSSKTGEKIDEDILYESAWRLGNWDALDGNQFLYSQNNFGSKLDITERDYHFYHYHALKCFHEGNEGGVADAIRNARASVIKALRNTSLESNKTIYKKLTQLQLIREIEDLKFVKENDYGKVLDKWQQQNIANFNDFRYMEPILTQRTVMFQINDTLANNSNIKHALFNTYLQLSKIAADKDNLQIATRSLVVLAKQSDLSSKIQDRLLYQEALLARHRNDLDVGRCLLLNLINKNTLDGNLRAQILRVYGDWMAETKSENPQTVIEEYYLRSINLSMSINEQSNDHEIVKNLHDTQVALARFADTQFEQISSYMKSPQFEILKECVTYSYKTIDEQSVPEDRDVRQAMFLSRRQNTNDAEELEHIQKERNNYLILALKYYLRTLQQSESYNLLVFRVIALWLDNVHHKEVNDLLEENLNFIPSFKFIPLVPQLAAHITEDLDQFHAKIYNIMRRCALEHPHHTLPVLLALKNLYGDCDNSSIRKGKTPEPRVLGARKLLKELGKFNIRKIIFEMERLSRALVTLANLPATSAKAGVIVKIPKNQEILKIKQFESIYVPTLRINVNPSQHYNSVVGVAKYAETYETVGGINTPKKLVCIGTDGISRYQLIKGKDDLRQDAVMQQVFTVMNTLLRSHEETKRRKLAIRTYKVVPLTQRSGIVEWCDNTLPIAAVLVGTDSLPGLHKKYYPRDYTARQCKEKLAAATKYTPSRKLKVYMDCCEHMHPVMHHFFTEKYPSPETWFERRLAYTRSIATTSMAGYVLGLGDRHLNNILIDQTTAEVIHIDFGIAFEQGKVLPMPETIPFRLTRNIEAGMGVSGVEGTMRHCSEKTLTVLRDQKQIIITLLQVLLYDPLFKWTITPAKAHDIQSERSSRSVENNQYSTETNKSAERALLRIEQKLQGTEEGLVTSVSGQVERLIQEARDPMNLCRVFCGWQPYL